MRLLAASLILCATVAGQTGAYAPPLSPRAKLNFDANWKFVREDVSGAEALAFDDSAWATVSTPHSFNDVDSFRQIISHSGGGRGTPQRPRTGRAPLGRRVPLIDLTQMSIAFYEALGPEDSPLAFSGGRDITHHSAYGAYELAKCVVEGVRVNHLDLARYLAADYKPFDPAHPDSPTAFDIPPSPRK